MIPFWKPEGHVGHYLEPRLDMNNLKSSRSGVFLAKWAKKASAKGRSLMKEVDVSPRNKLYLLIGS